MKKTISLIAATFVLLVSTAAIVDLNNLFNYANQVTPTYIVKDNTGANAITDAGATLGRVLFYDKNLSSNNTIACASCHIQEFAFGDTAQVSQGVNGVTGRHSMRLANARFGNEIKFFWDERADSLEQQTTMPIQDHGEMGFSGTLGDPDFNDLLAKLDTIDYYDNLFQLAFGDTNITEDRIQKALAQFVRSIQSFDSKFDTGFAQVTNILDPFPNYTVLENQGKQLFFDPPPAGGAGCVACHRAPEFDIDPNSLNNGVIGVANSTATDLTNTRSPSLRNITNQNGDVNGPMMHNGVFTTLMQVINHYNQIPNVPTNTNLDPRLNPGGMPQMLNLTIGEKDALVAFLKTLAGSDVYTNPKWSDPFDANGNISVIGGPLSVEEQAAVLNLNVYPNPAVNSLNITGNFSHHTITLFSLDGRQIAVQNTLSSTVQFDLSSFARGVYLLRVNNEDGETVKVEKIIKQ